MADLYGYLGSKETTCRGMLAAKRRWILGSASLPVPSAPDQPGPQWFGRGLTA